jgi:hypothetical protein
MTGEELRAIRMQLNMTLHQLGLWLIEKMNVGKPPPKSTSRGCSRHRVHDWESGRVALSPRRSRTCSSKTRSRGCRKS